MIHQLSERIRNALNKRHNYRACFLNEQGILTAHGQRVFKDLANYTDAYRSTIKMRPDGGGIDPIAMGIAEGRRQVCLRLLAMLKLPDEEVLKAMEQET